MSPPSGEAPRVLGGDQAGTYVYVANAHDGSMAVTAAVTPIRIVCANTLGYALSRAEGLDSQRTSASATRAASTLACTRRGG